MDINCTTVMDGWGELAGCRLIWAAVDGRVLWGAKGARRLLETLPKRFALDLEPMVKQVVAQTLAQDELGGAWPAKAELVDQFVSDRLGCRAGLIRDAAGDPQAVLIELRASTSDPLPPSRLLQILNHEIRTPLSSLHGFAELMLTREFGESQRRHFLQTIRQESSRLAAILGDFVELERIDSGKGPLNLKMAEMGALVRKILEKAVDPARIQLRLPSDPVKARIDPSRVGRVLEILTANALGSGSSLVTVSLTCCGRNLTVSVTDSGPLIPPEALPHLFSKSYSPLQVGWPRFAGFGLPLARSIVEAHQGAIQVESSADGNVFSFRLPLSQSDRGAAKH